jgi:predicted nucleotidyltransferase
VDGFTVYVFGSVLSGGSRWADIDVLIVVATAADGDYLRQALDPLVATVPLHVTIVLQTELDELGLNAWGRLHKLMVR